MQRIYCILYQYPPLTDIPNFANDIQNYFSALSLVGHRVVRLLALSLGLDADFFAKVTEGQ
jgi:isopenicillin N synthase-like dioxygenase